MAIHKGYFGVRWIARAALDRLCVEGQTVSAVLLAPSGLLGSHRRWLARVRFVMMTG